MVNAPLLRKRLDMLQRHNGGHGEATPLKQFLLYLNRGLKSGNDEFIWDETAPHVSVMALGENFLFHNFSVNFLVVTSGKNGLFAKTEV